MTQSKTKTEICDRCNNYFERKWVPAFKDWSRLNLISRWSGSKELLWEEGNRSYDLVCLTCLSYWYEHDKKSFHRLVPVNVQKDFRTYRHRKFI